MKKIVIYLLPLIIISCSKYEGKKSMAVSDSKTTSFFSEQEAETEDQSLTRNRGTFSKVRLENATATQNVEIKEVKLIKKAHLTLEVGDYHKWYPSLTQLVESGGGYISNSQVSVRKDDYKSGTIVVRIPKERFQQTLDGIKKLGKLLSENIDSQDVTEQYLDLNVRLNNKKITESRFKEIMKNRVAKISDLVYIEKELQKLSEEIDRITGRINYLNNQIGYSTINVNVYETESKKSFLFFSEIGNTIGSSFKDGVRGLIAVVGGLILLLVGGIPVYIIAFIGWKLYKKRKSKALSS